MDKNTLINDKAFDELSASELVRKLTEKSSFIRARALAALARYASRHPAILDDVAQAILDPKNINVKVIGIVSVSYIGIYCLLMTKNEECKNKALQVISNMPEQERINLRWWLQVEGVSLQDLE